MGKRKLSGLYTDWESFSQVNTYKRSKEKSASCGNVSVTLRGKKTFA